MWNLNKEGITELVNLFKNSSSCDNEMQKEIFVVSIIILLSENQPIFAK